MNVHAMVRAMVAQARAPLSLRDAYSILGRRGAKVANRNRRRRALIEEGRRLSTGQPSTAPVKPKQLVLDFL